MANRVLVADPIATEGVELLQSQAEVDVRTGLSRDELKAIIGGYDALVVRSETRVTADVIEVGKRLQVIGRAGVGIDNIDVDAATQHGIIVVNAPTGNTIAAAEHTIALMLAVARHIPQAYAALKAGRWARSAYVGNEVRGKTIGIIGLGRVGTEVASRARGLEMRVIGYDPYVATDYGRSLGIELASFEDVLSKSDFLTFHTPLTPTTRGLIGANELAQMKPSAYIINVARGGIVDEQALYDAVESGRIAGAAVDVFSQEPTTDNVVITSDKIVVTPHLGASTTEAQTVVATDVAEQILAVLKGRPARYAVNAPFVPQDVYPAISGFLEVAPNAARIAGQMARGQPSTITITYEGDLARYDTALIKAAIVGALLRDFSEERVNIVNAEMVARARGLRILEQKVTECENYGSLITIAVTTDAGTSTVAGTLMRGEAHIVRIADFWLDIIPTAPYMVVIDHRDRPGLIGAVGTITGAADVNISWMHLSREAPRGHALMVLGIDDFAPDDMIRQMLAIPDVYNVVSIHL